MNFRLQFDLFFIYLFILPTAARESRYNLGGGWTTVNNLNKSQIIHRMSFAPMGTRDAL